MNKLLISIFCFSALLFASSVEVSVITPELNSDAITIEADGVVLSKNIALTAQTNGVVHFYINDNVNVNKGELIAKVIDTRREKKLNTLKERLIFLDNEVKFENERVQAAEDKYKMGVASKNDYFNEKIMLEQFKESQKLTLSDYEILKLEEEKSVIKAQDNGFITQLSNENKFVNYGDSLGILTPQDAQVKLFVDAKYAQSINKGMPVNIQSGYGKTTAVVRDILAQTSSNLLEVMVTPNSLLPLNLQLKAVIIIKKFKALKIPKSAVVLVDNQPAVYVIQEGVAHLKFIEIQKDMINFTLIKNTLSKDSKIALKNAYMLQDDLEVVVK